MPTRLTALAIERIKPGTSRREIADAGCAGLYLILQPTGAKSWAIRFRIDGEPAKFTLGAWPRLDLSAAREQARRAMELVDRGIDPRQQREEEHQEHARRRANTLRAVAEKFLDKHMKQVRPRTWKDSWSALDRYVLCRLGDRPIESIRRRDLHDVLDDLADKPGARHHVVSAVGSLFRWALDRAIIEANPAVQMPRPKIGVRERALSDEEIPVLWDGAEAVGYPFGPFVQLLLLTGCRRNEIAGVEWSEIDLDRDMITVPIERYKTGRTLVVPLSPPARGLIDVLPRHADGDFVLSTTSGRRPISGYSKMKRRFDAALAKCCETAGREPFDFDLHDLRRTVRTNLSALRIAPHIAEAVLGHVLTGVQKHYDKWTYLDEKREALEAWARKLQKLIVPRGNIRPLSPDRPSTRGPPA